MLVKSRLYDDGEQQFALFFRDKEDVDNTIMLMKEGIKKNWKAIVTA